MARFVDVTRMRGSELVALLLSRARTSDERCRLLERAGVLSTTALADRRAVVALLESVRITAQAAWLAPRPPNFGVLLGDAPPSSSLPDEQARALGLAGFLDRDCERTFDWERAEPIINERDARAMERYARDGAAPPRADGIPCGYCWSDDSPAGATYCGRCGYRLR
jgi:hypothetical protein